VNRPCTAMNGVCYSPMNMNLSLGAKMWERIDRLPWGIRHLANIGVFVVAFIGMPLLAALMLPFFVAYLVYGIAKGGLD
jgi:hypothetical protein